MFQEIFSSLFFFILIYLNSVGYGKFFQQLIIGDNRNNSLGITGFFGLFFLSFISVFFHFFIPLNNIFNSIILFIGIIFVFIYKSFNEQYLKREYYVIYIIIIPSLILFEYHADYFWYHLPYINLVNDFKIIFGIANLNDNLGYGHIWYDLLAIFQLPYFGTKYLSIVSILFLSFFLIFLKDMFEKSNEKIIKIFVFFCFCFVCLIYSNSKDFGSEIQGNLIYLMISLLFLNYYLINDSNFKNYLITCIVLLFYFAILIRTNSIIFTPLILVFFIHNTNLIVRNILTHKFFYSFLFFFSLLYLLKNFIISGCLAYPIYFTCLDSIEWGVGIEQAKLRFYHLSSQSKGYLLYLINENFIKNIFNYYKFREDKDFFNPETYLANYNWLRIWWQYEYDINRFLNIIYFFVFSLIIILIFNLNKINFNQIIVSIRKYFIHIIFFSLPVFSWLYLLPQTRYGGYGIIFSVICLCTLLFFYKIKDIKIFPFIIIFTISISYYGYKNIDRIINNFYGLSLEEFNNYYEYPNIENNQFKVNNQFQVTVIERVINNKDRLGKPLYCFDIKGLCASSFRLKCIEKIHKKYNYIFVIPNQKKCALVIDKYLWY